MFSSKKTKTKAIKNKEESIYERGGKSPADNQKEMEITMLKSLAFTHGRTSAMTTNEAAKLHAASLEYTKF